MLIKIFVFNRDGRLIHARRDVFVVDHQRVVAVAFVFPQEFIVAVVVLGDGRADALRQSVRIDLVEVFAVVSEQRRAHQHHQQHADAGNFQQHKQALLTEPILRDALRVQPIKQPLDRVFRQSR